MKVEAFEGGGVIQLKMILAARLEISRCGVFTRGSRAYPKRSEMPIDAFYALVLKFGRYLKKCTNVIISKKGFSKKNFFAGDSPKTSKQFR